MYGKKVKLRFLFLVLIIFSVILSVFLILQSLKNNVVYFQSPSEIKSLIELDKKKIRVGGMVKKESISINSEEISFVITDLVIGYHSGTHWTWGSVFFIGLISSIFTKNIKLRMCGALLGACIFFVITKDELDEHIYDMRCGFGKFVPYFITQCFKENSFLFAFRGAACH